MTQRTRAFCETRRCRQVAGATVGRRRARGRAPAEEQEDVTMTLPASDHLSRRRVLGSLAAIPVIQALQGATATQAQTTAIAPDHLTAIDIALEPDATMIQHAKAANARLLKDFPKGFALDATHHPHVSGERISTIRTGLLKRAAGSSGPQVRWGSWFAALIASSTSAVPQCARPDAPEAHPRPA
jgi:hypothetical protein